MNKITPDENPSFYPLTNDEWVRAKQELKPAQRDVLYYLKTLDPSGCQQIEINGADIARAMDLSKGTVSRALRDLASSGWIELTPRSASISIKPIGGVR